MDEEWDQDKEVQIWRPWDNTLAKNNFQVRNPRNFTSGDRKCTMKSFTLYAYLYTRVVSPLPKLQ